MSEITCLYWNINSDRRCEAGYAKSYKNGKFINRFPGIKETIATTNPTIVCLVEHSQETSPFTIEFLKESGYNVTSSLYSDNPSGFVLLIAVKGNIIATQNYTFTKNPEKYIIRPHGYDNMSIEEKQEHKSFLDNELFPGEEYEKSILFSLVEIDGKLLVVAVTHLGLRLDYKIFSANMINKLTKDFMTKNNTLNIPVIIGGDLNTFKCEIQEGKLSHPVLESISQDFKYPENVMYSLNDKQ
jgi:hypothetical protein